MLQKLLTTAAVIALTTGVAHAQVTGNVAGTGPVPEDGFNVNMMPSIPQSRDNAEAERRYQETLKNKIPDKKVSNDPWRTVRPTKPQQ
jgi:hypothetical protein